jgi:F420-non-reducing hydrogenase iron-sulfur subunit
MRLDYPPNVKIIKVPCTGRVDVIHILKALEDGADGVMVAGCLEGDCHYQSGNLRAKKRVTYVQNILDQIGFGAERVAMYNLSAGMGVRFAEIAREITEKVKELGPNPIRSAREASGESTKEAVHG